MIELENRDPEELSQLVCKWHDIAETLGNDLAQTLDLCMEYQRMIAMLAASDPHVIEVKKLFAKYNRAWTEHTRSPQVFLNGENISYGPESIALIEDEEGIRFLLIEDQ